MAVLAAATAHAARGHLDRHFGEDGKVMISLGKVGETKSLAVDSRNRTVIMAQGSRGLVLIRLKEKGALDRSFGRRGMVRLDERFGKAWAVDGRDRILIGGVVARNPADMDIGVTRLLRDGSVDGSFGEAGTATIDHRPIDVVWTLTADPQNRVIVGGADGDLFSPDPGPHPLAARLLEDGRLDPSFGAGGFVSTPYAGQFNRVALDGAGRLLLAVNKSVGQGTPAPGVLRTDPDGHPDPTYNAGEPVDATDGYPVRSLNVDDRGRALLTSCHYSRGLRAVRLDADGELDRSFGKRGEVSFGLGRSERGCASTAIPLPHGRVAVGGSAPAGHGRAADFVVLWLARDGRLDRRAGHRGITLTDFDGLSDNMNGMALTPSGHVMAAGYARADVGRNPRQVAVARYTP
jgi:uncharacterized delta-60 repeat protein